MPMLSLGWSLGERGTAPIMSLDRRDDGRGDSGGRQTAVTRAARHGVHPRPTGRMIDHPRTCMITDTRHCERRPLAVPVAPMTLKRASQGRSC